MEKNFDRTVFDSVKLELALIILLLIPLLLLSLRLADPWGFLLALAAGLGAGFLLKTRIRKKLRAFEDAGHE